MNNKIKILFAAVTLLAFGCHPNTPQGSSLSISPEAGTSYKAGDAVKVSLGLGSAKMDSVVYLVDSVKVGSKKDSSALSLKTDSMRLGNKLITAKVYSGGQTQDVSTNIILMAAKAPEEMTFVVEKTYPHDTSSYTEGLLYQDGYLYEGAGANGHSDIRKVDVNTGKIVQRTALLDSKYFGEGIAIVGNKIVQLTYTTKVGFVYDKNTFKQIGTFNNNVGVEGWGMTFDGKKLYFDDSTNRIWFLDKDNYSPTGYIDVYDDKHAIDSVNELEYINGKLYSNIYQKDIIVIIDPKTGAVLQRVDMSNLWPHAKRPAGFDDDGNNVLNGIAWDEKGKRLFVTGKKWPHLYQVRFVKK